MGKVIAVDFDGVIHRFSQKWHDGSIYDPPIEGAREAMKAFLDAGHEVVIFTGRADDRSYNGQAIAGQWREVEEYLDRHKIPYTRVHHGEVGKPYFDVLIDDSAFRFEGDWEDTVWRVEQILSPSLEEETVKSFKCSFFPHPGTELLESRTVEAHSAKEAAITFMELINVHVMDLEFVSEKDKITVTPADEIEHFDLVSLLESVGGVDALYDYSALPPDKEALDYAEERRKSEICSFLSNKGSVDSATTNSKDKEKVIILDSGKRQEFSTGAVRDIREGKGRFDLLFSASRALTCVARHFEGGAKKYGDNNWLRGIPLSRFMDSMLRHAAKLSQGLDDEDHAAAMAWNAIAYVETRERIRAGILPGDLEDFGQIPKSAQIGESKTRTGKYPADAAETKK